MRLVWALLLVCVVIMTKRVVYHAATIKTQSTPRLLCISLNRRTKREVMNGGAEMNNLTFVEFCQLPRFKSLPPGIEFVSRKTYKTCFSELKLEQEA